jgi:hypothetical protein
MKRIITYTVCAILFAAVYPALIATRGKESVIKGKTYRLLD